MSTNGVGVLDKVMAVLAEVERTSPTEPKAVAAALDMTTPTTYRLMKAMASHGLLSVRDGQYSLGLRLLHLGHLVSARLDIVQVARPHLIRLKDRTNETAELHVLSGFRRVPVHFEVGTRSVRTSAQIGIPMPLHKGSAICSLLTHLDEASALDIVRRSAKADHELEEFDEAKYLARWRRARKRGYEIGAGERDPETGAAAAPVHGPDGSVVAQIVASGTAQRFRDRAHADMVIGELRPAAEAITADLTGGAAG